MVALAGVGADAEDDGMEMLEGFTILTEVLGFHSTAGGVIPGVEVENYPFTFEHGERSGAVKLVSEDKVGSRLGEVEFGRHSLIMFDKFK